MTPSTTYEKKRAFARAFIGKGSGQTGKPQALSLDALKGQYNARLGIVRDLEGLVDSDALPRHDREAKTEEMKTQLRLLNDTLRRITDAGYSPSPCEVRDGFTNNKNIATKQGANL